MKHYMTGRAGLPGLILWEEQAKCGIGLANDPNDKTSIKQIRTHLDHIVGMFSNGNFDAPMLNLNPA